jgi:hypothetical protein
MFSIRSPSSPTNARKPVHFYWSKQLQGMLLDKGIEWNVLLGPIMRDSSVLSLHSKTTKPQASITITSIAITSIAFTFTFTIAFTFTITTIAFTFTIAIAITIAFTTTTFTIAIHGTHFRISMHYHCTGQLCSVLQKQAGCRNNQSRQFLQGISTMRPFLGN